MSDLENLNQPHSERSLGLELGALELNVDAGYDELSASMERELAAADVPEPALNLARKLRQRNRQLVERVAELEQALIRAQQAHPQVALEANSDELLAASHQVSALLQELEASHQVAQRQQVLIETLSRQLETAQAQIAQLERECVLAKQHYADQMELASAAVENSHELRDRLNRQKQQVLQFRASLNRYRDEPPTSSATRLAAVSPPVAPQPPRISADLTAPTPPPLAVAGDRRGQPIRPWSAREAGGAIAPQPPTWIDRWLDRRPLSPAPTPPAAPPAAFAPEDDEAIPPEVFSNALRAELSQPFYAASTEVDEVLASWEQPEHSQRELTVAEAIEATQPSKKRPSLAAVELPYFPRVR